MSAVVSQIVSIIGSVVVGCAAAWARAYFGRKYGNEARKNEE